MKPSEIKAKIKREVLAKEAVEDSKLCSNCKGLGYTFVKFGKVQTCFKCLQKRWDDDNGKL